AEVAVTANQLSHHQQRDLDDVVNELANRSHAVDRAKVEPLLRDIFQLGDDAFPGVYPGVDRFFEKSA
ncbi:MAG: hypothetical protein KY459_10225, partial [Acidobacteria bacterium]|nr:hypothetical protein [Acidobacteriota bacterium]